MVDLYEGPSREGTRGGLEQFTWESIKAQGTRDRECYLGQSVRVGIQGKFGRFSTNDWWIRKREDPKTLDEEKDLLKRFEEELMQEALGVKPKRLLLVKGELTDSQKLELLASIPPPLDEEPPPSSKRNTKPTSPIDRPPCISTDSPLHCTDATVSGHRSRSRSFDRQRADFFSKRSTRDYKEKRSPEPRRRRHPSRSRSPHRRRFPPSRLCTNSPERTTTTTHYRSTTSRRAEVRCYSTAKRSTRHWEVSEERSAPFRFESRSRRSSPKDNGHRRSRHLGERGKTHGHRRWRSLSTEQSN